MHRVTQTWKSRMVKMRRYFLHFCLMAFIFSCEFKQLRIASCILWTAQCKFWNFANFMALFMLEPSSRITWSFEKFHSLSIVSIFIYYVTLWRSSKVSHFKTIDDRSKSLAIPWQVWTNVRGDRYVICENQVLPQNLNVNFEAQSFLRLAYQLF